MLFPVSLPLYHKYTQFITKIYPFYHYKSSHNFDQEELSSLFLKQFVCRFWFISISIMNNKTWNHSSIFCDFTLKGSVFFYRSSTTIAKYAKYQAKSYNEHHNVCIISFHVIDLVLVSLHLLCFLMFVSEPLVLQKNWTF